MSMPDRRARAVLALERAERRIVLAINRWQKLRAQVRRQDSRAEKAALAGGEFDQFAEYDRLKHEPVEESQS